MVVESCRPEAINVRVVLVVRLLAANHFVSTREFRTWYLLSNRLCMHHCVRTIKILAKASRRIILLDAFVAINVDRLLRQMLKKQSVLRWRPLSEYCRSEKS